MSRIRSRQFWRRWSWLISFVFVAAFIYGAGDHPVSTGNAQGNVLDGPATTQQASRRYLRIGTFNIDGGQGTDGKIDLDRTARCLQKLDFIGLNEVHGFLWGDTPNQASELSESLHLPYMYAPVERRWGRETFGNAVLSDLAVQSWKRVALPSHLFGAKRNYMLTDVLWNKRHVHFLTTHTDWKSGGVEQFEIVRDVFLSLPEPAVLMGDLNMPPSEPLIQRLKATPGVEEAVDTVMDKVPGRVDWIFLRGLKTQDASPVELHASDHPAYWASVYLK